MSSEDISFHDSFAGSIDSNWTWLREDPAGWRFTDDALEIRVEPGVADTVKNALLRPAPDRREGSFAIDVTVTNLTVPIQQYEQAGITWYVDGKPVFKIVKELIDGGLFIIPGRAPMDSVTVELRVIVTADSFTAQFRPEGETEFRTATTGALAAPGKDQVSVQCYNGPPKAEHWIQFRNFKITKLDA
ncbi:MAG: hypothetical protein O3B01_14820 [Planctomycetota bacterium]|nr:hypothetical protein [Planctomycetota bacterium]MDA1139844.1 hypothetical protein [Planctomycetota bacterium]